jgi:hypothetical protein
MKRALFNLIIKTVRMKSNKTAWAGFVAGAIPIAQAIFNAYQAHQFSGQGAGQIAAGIAIIIFGFVAKDFNVTGGTKQQ